ncbi:hypothetical protein ABE504_06290 [Paenibacillus oryzisoli]|uniref:nSTAND3 domain-containing NTPase n=1 Tax=Paenibacillus oryzisoli TaxID=1850517 RepID=UPI003D2A2F37
MRDEFTPKMKDNLSKRVGNRCSNPDCKKPTSGPHSDRNKHINIGVAAHITAASAGGPRYDASLTPEERKSEENGIWLCEACAKLIDSDEMKYTITFIKGWKQRSEEMAIADLESSAAVNESEKDLGKNALLTEAMGLEHTFVRTPFYDSALQALESNNGVLLSGYSMMGKTTTSIRLAAAYAESYDIVYNQSFSIIEERIKHHANKREVIVIDDFLGHYELLDENDLVKWEKLLQHVVRLPNKKVILNARKSLLANLKVQNEGFFSFLENRFVPVELDFSKSDIAIKAEILTSYIKSNQLPRPYMEKLGTTEVLTNILTHRNFSPLSVEFATKPRDVEPDHYVAHFMKYLDEPDTIWSNEIRALNHNANVYLHTLVSLSTTTIHQSIVDECFYKRFEATLDEFEDESLEDTVTRLEGSLIRRYSAEKISVYHPSLYTYVRKKMGEKEKRKIIDSALYVEQFEALNTSYSTEKLKKLIQNEDFLKLKVAPVVMQFRGVTSGVEIMDSILLKYLKYIHVFDIREKGLEGFIVAILDKVLINRLYLFHSINIVMDILSSQFYDLSVILSNEEHMKQIFSCSDVEIACRLIKICNYEEEGGINFRQLPLYMQEELKRLLGYSATDKITEFLASEMDDYISESMDEFGSDDLEETAYEMVQAMVDDFDLQITEIAEETFHREANKQKLFNINYGNIEYDIITDDGELYDTALEKLERYEWA